MPSDFTSPMPSSSNNNGGRNIQPNSPSALAGGATYNNAGKRNKPNGKATPDQPVTGASTPAENMTLKQPLLNNWALYRGTPTRTGYTEEQLNFPLKLAWKYSSVVGSTDVGKINPSSPAVVDGIIYFCSARRLYAVNAETGTLKWAYPKDGLAVPIKSSPLVGDDLVYFGGGDGKLYAVTKDTGALAWSFVTRGIMSSSPVLVDGVVYIGSGDDHLYALDAQTGQMKWPGGFHTRDDVSSSPAVADGLVYFISTDMVLYAAHTTTGQIKWMTRIGSASPTISPVVAANTVYIAAGNIIQAYQSKSGNLKWGYTMRSEITTLPAVANGVIYFGTVDGKLHAMTNAGKEKWGKPAELGAAIYSSPIVAGNTVIVGANKGTIAAFDTETGEMKWRYIATPATSDQGKLKYASITSSPVVSDGALYVLADDGTLYAFRSDMPDKTPPYVQVAVPTMGMLLSSWPPCMALVICELIQLFETLTPMSRAYLRTLSSMTPA